MSSEVTKVRPPTLRNEIVHRPRLVGRLMSPLPRLVLFCAPAGFGKTTLALDWLRQASRPFAWLSLDAHDNEPARFAARLNAALRTLDASTTGSEPERPPAPRPAALDEVLLSRAAERLTAEGATGVIVLDDFHHIYAPAVHQKVRELLETLGPELHVFILTRVDPPLPLGRLRVSGDLLEVREQDLRFTRDEASAFFRLMLPDGLPAHLVDLLEERTEGWAAGLRMAGLALQGTVDPEVVVKSFTGNHHFVMDYLLEEAFARQPGAVQTFRRPAGAVDKLFIEINGALQGMFITRSDRSLPALLYLHGRMPDFFLEKKYPSALEQCFTVVWWEQRGSGMSRQPGAPQHLVTVEQLIDDTLVLSDHLRRRFDQPRIYLMGHSGGTFLRVQAAARAPELFHAYVAVAQIADQLESETLAYRYMLAEFRKRGDSRLARRLERCPVTEERGTPAAYMRVRDVAMHRLGVGTTLSMRSLVSGILVPSLLCSDYTVGERLKLWAAKARSGASVVWEAMLATDLRQRVKELGVPVYFLHGVHD